LPWADREVCPYRLYLKEIYAFFNTLGDSIFRNAKFFVLILSFLNKWRNNPGGSL